VVRKADSSVRPNTSDDKEAYADEEARLQSKQGNKVGRNRGESGQVGGGQRYPTVSPLACDELRAGLQID